MLLARKFEKHVPSTPHVLRGSKSSSALHHWKVLIELHYCPQFYVAKFNCSWNHVSRAPSCVTRVYVARALVTCIIRHRSWSCIAVPNFGSPAQEISISDVLWDEGTHSLHVQSTCIRQSVLWFVQHKKGILDLCSWIKCHAGSS